MGTMGTQIRLFIEWDGIRAGIVLWVAISTQTFLSSAGMFDYMPTVRASTAQQQQQKQLKSEQ